MHRTRPARSVLTIACFLVAFSLSPAPLSAADHDHGATAEAARTMTPTSEAAVFETFKGLAGTWIGKSTKGWEEEVTIKAIAGGSVVVLNSFDAHPGEEMITTYYLDGDELQLRHFCIAGNQPRLEVTEVADGGKRITFTFKDATNLASRDKGHMDKVVYQFADGDSYSSRWTWYQDGKESWMEEVRYRRIR